MVAQPFARSEEVVYDRLQQLRTERLGHIDIGPFLVARNFVLVGDLGRENDDRNVAQSQVVLDAVAEFVPVHLRHQDIGDHHVRHLVVDQREPVGAVVGRQHAEAVREDHLAVVQQLQIVLDDDDFRERSDLRSVRFRCEIGDDGCGGARVR